MSAALWAARLLALVAACSFAAPVRAGWFGPSDWAECALAKLPGTKNDVVASHIVAECRKRFPPATTPPAKKRDMSAHKCIIRHARSTVSEIAAQSIAEACIATYPGD